MTMEWQPIETAPKNGVILVWDENETWEIAYYHRGKWRYGPKGYSFNPTHWMPLPDPPKNPLTSKPRACSEGI
jgi:hypothetical protein